MNVSAGPVQKWSYDLMGGVYIQKTNKTKQNRMIRYFIFLQSKFSFFFLFLFRNKLLHKNYNKNILLESYNVALGASLIFVIWL